MAKRHRVLVFIFAFVLDILAVALSYIAYTKRIKVEDVSNFNGVCTYPKSQLAFALGIFAALVLLAGQLTINFGMRCFCCRGVRCYPKCTTIIAIILFILSWFAFAIAFIGLIYTAILSNRKFLAKHNSENNNNVGGICFIGKENLFLGAIFWCIVSTVSGLVSYGFWVCATNHRNNTNHQTGYGNSDGYGQSGISMGQPSHAQLSKEQF